MKKLCILTIAGLVVATSAVQLFSSDGKSKESTLTILYTSCARGQIRSCNCTKFRFGGYGRQLTLLKQIRERNNDCILLEGGDVTGGTGWQSEMKAEVAAKALKMLDYDIVSIGEEDLGLVGVRNLEKLEAESLPMVCANLTDLEKKQLKYADYSVVRTGNGTRVGVIALIAPSFGGDFLEKGLGESITDVKEALKAALDKVRPKSDIVVLLYHGEPDDKLKFEGVDFVLYTHRNDKDYLFPKNESNEVVAPIEVKNGSAAAKSETYSNWSLGQIDLVFESGGKVKSADHKLLYLDRRYDEDPEMVKIYDEYSIRTTETVLSRSSKFKEEAEQLLRKRGLDPAAMRDRLRRNAYASADRCKECHQEIYENWSATGHAKAINALQKTNQHFDPECIECHVTGAKAKSGFSNYKDTPHLANVQCEACHGPATAHIKDPANNKTAKVTEDACRCCHTADRHPDFDFKSAWAKAAH